MNRLFVALLLCSFLCIAASCGQEHFKTPEKTLAFYFENKPAGSAAQMNAVLTCFTKSDQDWFQKHYRTICDKLYGLDCPAGEVQAQSTIWTDKIEPVGPSSGTADSIKVDDKAGTAVVTVGGNEYDMVKEGADWKFDGMFGADAALQEKYHLD